MSCPNDDDCPSNCYGPVMHGMWPYYARGNQTNRFHASSRKVDDVEGCGNWHFTFRGFPKEVGDVLSLLYVHLMRLDMLYIAPKKKVRKWGRCFTISTFVFSRCVSCVSDCRWTLSDDCDYMRNWSRFLFWCLYECICECRLLWSQLCECYRHDDIHCQSEDVVLTLFFYFAIDVVFESCGFRACYCSCNNLGMPRG